jgi:hypothetical protein
MLTVQLHQYNDCHINFVSLKIDFVPFLCQTLFLCTTLILTNDTGRLNILSELKVWVSQLSNEDVTERIFERLRIRYSVTSLNTGFASWNVNFDNDDISFFLTKSYRRIFFLWQPLAIGPEISSVDFQFLKNWVHPYNNY